MKNLAKYILALMVLTSFLTSCCCPSNPAPDGMISDATALEMQTLYINNQHSFINEALGLPPGSDQADNLNVLFNLEDFEEYICLAKNIAKDSSYSNLGLRVYFGAKPDANGIPKSTVFFVPTFTDSIGNPLDFPSGAFYNMGDSGNGDIGNNGGGNKRKP